jgi:hypothetical protein
MEPNDLDRRRVLVRLGSAAGLIALGMRPARALTLEDNPALQKQYDAVCESQVAHERRIHDLVAELETGMTVSAEDHARNVERVAAQRCPACGCKLGPMDPYPAKF